MATEDGGALPTIGALGGSDPDFTGGLSSADYLRQLRGGDLDLAAALQMAQAEIRRLVAANLRVRAERDALRAGLETLRRDHLIVEDEPYCSCPQSGQCGGLWAWQDVPCDCGADAHNARIDALLSGGHE